MKKYKPKVKNYTIEKLIEWYEENVCEFSPDMLEEIDHLLEIAKENIRVRDYLNNIESKNLKLLDEVDNLKDDLKNCTENFNQLVLEKNPEKIQKLCEKKSTDPSSKYKMFISGYHNMFDHLKEMVKDELNLDNTKRMKILGEAVAIIIFWSIPISIVIGLVAWFVTSAVPLYVLSTLWGIFVLIVFGFGCFGDLD